MPLTLGPEFIDPALPLPPDAAPTPAAPEATSSTRPDMEKVKARTRELFTELGAVTVGTTDHLHVRNELVQLHLPMVEHCARRFRNRGEPFEDLVQIGTIGLVNAVERFDVGRGVEFSTFAMPTVIGEIKRHFRDRGWAIRLPRRLQELRLEISTATAQLSQTLGRSPSPAEIAVHLDRPVDEVIEAIASSHAHYTLPLDRPTSASDTSLPLSETLAGEDGAMEYIEIRESIMPLLEKLDERERQILILRFFKNMSQSQIAEEIGVSQMHVSRLLTRTLTRLRSVLEHDWDGVSAHERMMSRRADAAN